MQAKIFAPIAVLGIDGQDHLRPGCRTLRSIKLCTALTAALLVAAAAEAQVRPGGTAPDQKAKYAVDGRALGSRVGSDGATADYKCGASEQFDGFTWCQRTSRDRARRGAFDAIHSILHAKDGTVVYVNRHQQPAFLDAGEAEREIQKYTRLFGESPKISKLPRRPGGPEATIATWGKIELEPLDGDSIKLVADGKSPRKGFLLDYLGNLSRSAQDGLPIYRMRGGTGFAWAASFDPRGRGTLRLVALDASALQPETTASQPETATQPASPGKAGDKGGDVAQAADPPAPASRDEPAPAPKGSGDAGGPIARLQSELASAREEKAQAEEAARLARTDAETARKEMEEARQAADAASQEIDRLKQAVVAPSSYLDSNNAIPIGAGTVAILVLGIWLGSRLSRWRATRAAASDADARTEDVAGLSPPAASDQQDVAVDQEGLVRELGKQLGLEEVAAPSMADPVSDNSLEPVSQQESVAPPVAASVPSEQAPPNSEAKAAAA